MNRIAKENSLRHRWLTLGATLLAAWCGMVAPAPALAEADNAAARQQVSAAIERYLAEMKSDRYTRLDADVQPVDTRLNLQTCSQPLAVEHSPKERMGGRITLLVSCLDGPGWSVRIPATVQLFDHVVVAGTSIPMGTQLSGKELSLQEMDVALLYRGYYRDIKQIRGFVTKRPIPAGQVLSPVTVNPANLVSKGETVAILAEAPGITIRATGVAMTDGAMGELIQVRNTKSNKVVEGRVSAVGQIKVGL